MRPRVFQHGIGANALGDCLVASTHHYTEDVEREFDSDELTCRLEVTSQLIVPEKHYAAIFSRPVSSCNDVRTHIEVTGMTSH